MNEPLVLRDLLVVTDEVLDAGLWRNTLQNAGWHVYFAETPDETYDCLQASLPSACLLDLPASAAAELLSLIGKGKAPVTMLVTDHNLLSLLPHKSSLIHKPLSPAAILAILSKSVQGSAGTE